MDGEKKSWRERRAGKGEQGRAEGRRRGGQMGVSKERAMAWSARGARVNRN